MRILLVNHFPLMGSGSGTYTREIARALKNEGHEVAMVYPEHEALRQTFNQESAESPYIDEIGLWHAPIIFYNDLSHQAQEADLPFNFPCFTSHPRSYKTYYELTGEEIDLYLAAFEKALKKMIDLFNPDLLHVQHIWIGAYAAWKTGIPYVVTCHGTDLMGYENDVRYRAYAEVAAKGAQKIIGVSTQVAHKVKETYPIEPSKVITMISGYNEEMFNLSEREPLEIIKTIKSHNEQAIIVSFAGKMTAFKGVDILLKAASYYEAQTSDIHTVLAGNGILYEELRTAAQQLNLKRLHFIGNVQQEALSSLYQSAALHVVPSREEPFGLVAVEALACGTPVIGTNAGGLPEIIYGGVGSLVPLEDDLALASAICEWTKKNSDRSHATVCHEHAKRYFSWVRVAKELTELFCTCLTVKA